MKLDTRHERSGFTLVELSVVLLIIATIAGSMIALFSASLEGRSNASTQKKLEALQAALLNYRIAYNRLPCPANYATYAMSDANFGIEAASTGNCRGGTPAADLGDATAAVGMIPVRTLGLPDDMAVDSWGRRIRYAVAPAFTASGAFDSIAATDTTTRISVTDNANAAAVATTAAYVLSSAGKNGHGARGGATGTLINTAITNTNELLNCKCNADGTANISASMDDFVSGEVVPDSADRLNDYDDLTVFATRVMLRGPAE